MPRLKLEALDNYPFQHSFEVRVTDLNYGQHLGNDALVGLIHSCRVRLLTNLGFSEEAIGTDTGIIMADLAVSFQSEAFLHDTLIIASSFQEIKNSGFRLYHRVTRDETCIALVESGFVAFDYAQRRTTRLPQTFVEKIR